MAINASNLTRLAIELEKAVGKGAVLSTPAAQRIYGMDGGFDVACADLVVLPSSTEEVQTIVRLAREYDVPVVPRGAGTGLSGGAVPVHGGLVVGFARMNRILKIDIENRRATVGSGVVTMALCRALEPYGFTYAPDPSSRNASTLGGNVAENAGGPHCLKYGITGNHVIGLKVVRSEGTVLQLGEYDGETAEYDLRGVMIGSEGMLGLVTEVVTRIIPVPEDVKAVLAAFPSMDAAARTVSDIVASGTIPATLEFMDRYCIELVERAYHLNYPPNAEALLIMDVEGLTDSLERQTQSIEAVCRAGGASLVWRSQTADERDRIWMGRRGIGAAQAKIRPNTACFDCAVPRPLIPQALRRIMELAEEHRALVTNTFHAGDGNLHPTVLFDATNEEEVRTMRKLGHAILRMCVDMGGTITGEHGVGLEKKAVIPYAFPPSTLDLMRLVKEVFDPTGFFNPGKVFPDEVAEA